MRHTQHLLSLYPTTLTQDRELLKTPITSRHRNAILIRIEEKSQLNLLLSRLQFFKSKLENEIKKEL